MIKKFVTLNIAFPRRIHFQGRRTGTKLLFIHITNLLLIIYQVANVRKLSEALNCKVVRVEALQHEHARSSNVNG